MEVVLTAKPDRVAGRHVRDRETPTVTRRTSLAYQLRHVRAQLAAERKARVAAEERAAVEHYNATHDGLTGLLNRDGWMQAWPSYTPTLPAVAVVDLDRFKQINDRHGHAAGDLLLRTVAARMVGVSGCLPGRFGGDEFVFYLPGEYERAVEVITAVCFLVGAPVDVGGGVWVSVGVSAGVAFVDGCGLQWLLDRADAAAYRVKRAGGGVAVFDRRWGGFVVSLAGCRSGVCDLGSSVVSGGVLTG